MATKYESLLEQTWHLRDDLRDLLKRAERLDENGHLTRSLERIELDLTADLAWLVVKVREERGLPAK